MTTKAAQCRTCGLLFKSTTTFDAHRTGKYAPIGQPDTRRCLSSEELRAKGYSPDSRGIWRRPDTSQRHTTTTEDISAHV